VNHLEEIGNKLTNLNLKSNKVMLSTVKILENHTKEQTKKVI
jgi:hypothetical protein